MKKYYFLIIVALILGLVLTGCTLLSNVGQVPATEQSGIAYLTKHIADDPFSTPLIAGGGNPESAINVGDVLVWNEVQDEENYLCVKYQLSDDALADGWLLTETHFAVACGVARDGEGNILPPSSDAIPQKNGNPPPGQFPYGDDNLGGAESYQECIPLSELGVEPGDEIYIAAHAVVIKVIGEGCGTPFWATGYNDYLPGTNINYNQVLYSDPGALLSEPNALYISSGWTGFVSLGFGGSVIVNFEYPIYNGPGDYDISVHEVTGTYPGFRPTYPEESVDVYVISDGTEYFAGRATNHDYGIDPDGIGKISIPEGILYVDAVKFVDTTDREDFSSSPLIDDAYDIDAVDACYLVEQEETAWAGEEDFPGKNWATYFTYTVQRVCPCILEKSSNIEVLDTPPDNVQVGKFENDDYVRVWKEFEGPLPADLYYDLDEGLSARTGGPPDDPQPYIDAGTPVCIYYVHLDNVGPSETVTHTGYIEFGANILGLIISGGNLGTFKGRDLMFAADSSVGNSGTTYPTTTGVDYLRGFDVRYGGNLDDAVFNGQTVDFTMWVINAHDSFRVILPMVP